MVNSFLIPNLFENKLVRKRTCSKTNLFENELVRFFIVVYSRVSF